MKIRVETSVFDDHLLQSSIEQTAERIRLEVREGYYTKTQIDQTATSITAMITSETDARTTIIRAQSGGVITAYKGQTYGVYTNASGSVDIVTLSWSGSTPSIASTIASYGSTITLGQVVNNTIRVVISSSAMEVISRSSGVDTSLASFGTTMRVGANVSGYSRVEIQSTGIDFIRKDTNDIVLAHIGYDYGMGESTSKVSPYYTFGRRKITTASYSSSSTYNIGNLCIYNNKIYVCKVEISTAEAWNADHWQYYIGNYSFEEGGDSIINVGSIASGSNSHAEGRETAAIGYLSHTEGRLTVALAEGAHAEGYATYATAQYSHSEGWGTKANGEHSHAQNFATIASKHAQTAIGTYNLEDTSSTTTHGSGYAYYGKYAFIVGNGTGSFDRANAFTVEWNGNVQYAGTISKMSDKNLKNHISYLSDDAIDFINKLKPAYYEKDNDLHLGFYAQDVEKIDTWKTFVGSMNGFKTLKYDDFIAPLVAYCQHLEKRIHALER